MIKLNGSLITASSNTTTTAATATAMTRSTQQKESLNNSFTFASEHTKLVEKKVDAASKKLGLLRLNHMNRSNSVDVASQRHKQTASQQPLTPIDSKEKAATKPIDLNTHTLIELHKFLKGKLSLSRS